MEGTTVSCGCVTAQKRRLASGRRTHGATDGGRKTAEYTTFWGMIERCENEKHRLYPHWGGRGIKVCAEWRHDFAAFLAYMGPRPSKQHTIDRVDNDRGYEPGNVRWATRAEQARNTSRNKWLTAFGKTLTVKDWAAEVGMKHGALRRRLQYGWPVELALTAPKGTQFNAYGQSPVTVALRASRAEVLSDASFEADMPTDPPDFDSET